MIKNVYKNLSQMVNIEYKNIEIKQLFLKSVNLSTLK